LDRTGTSGRYRRYAVNQNSLACTAKYVAARGNIKVVEFHRPNVSGNMRLVIDHIFIGNELDVFGRPGVLARLRLFDRKSASSC
jgi:hypothetical protein